MTARLPAPILRRLAPADVPLVARFEREIAEISFPDDPVTDLSFYERKLRQAIEDRRAEPIVAERNGQIVGWLWLAARENFTTKERYGDLRSFYVVPVERGAGVAFALMREARAIAEREGFARLVGRTAADNEAMKALYALYSYAPRHIVYELSLDRPDGARAAAKRPRSRTPGTRRP